LIVSDKSTEVIVLTGAGADDWPLVVALGAATFGATGAAAGDGLAASGFMALLEMTNLRRTGGVLTLGAFGELARLLPGADLGTVTLRFDINNQTKKHRAGSEKTMTDRKNTASDEIPAFMAVKLELRTPED
jgi:hypothetical protein